MLRKDIDSSTEPVDDRRLHDRFLGPINGSYTLSEHRESESAVEVYACRTQSITPISVAVTAPKLGSIGDWLTARLDGIGIVRGNIQRHLTDGFAFAIVATTQQQQRLAERIEWLRHQSTRHTADRRSHKRAKPYDPRSIITFEDGHTMTCFIVDFSRSGVAISADYTPQLGEQVVVGTLKGRVVRSIKLGFAVQYDVPQESRGLEELLHPMTGVMH